MGYIDIATRGDERLLFRTLAKLNSVFLLNHENEHYPGTPLKPGEIQDGVSEKLIKYNQAVRKVGWWNSIRDSPEVRVNMAEKPRVKVWR